MRKGWRNGGRDECKQPRIRSLMETELFTRGFLLTYFYRLRHVELSAVRQDMVVELLVYN